MGLDKRSNSVERSSHARRRVLVQKVRANLASIPRKRFDISLCWVGWKWTHEAVSFARIAECEPQPTSTVNKHVPHVECPLLPPMRKFADAVP